MHLQDFTLAHHPTGMAPSPSTLWVYTSKHARATRISSVTIPQRVCLSRGHQVHPARRLPDVQVRHHFQ